MVELCEEVQGGIGLRHRWNRIAVLDVAENDEALLEDAPVFQLERGQGCRAARDGEQGRIALAVAQQAVEGGEQVRVHPAEQPDRIGVPAPPQVVRQFAQACDARRQLGDNARRASDVGRELLLRVAVTTTESVAVQPLESVTVTV